MIQELIENGGHINCVNKETKLKISKTMKEKETFKNNPNCFKKGQKSPMKGKKHSEKAKLKIKEKRKKQVMISNKILCVETNEIFDSANEVEKKKNFSAKYIRTSCNDKNTAYGYHWKYIKPKKRKKSKNKNSKIVLCIETNEKYLSITEAQRKTNIKHIRDACIGKRKSAGKLHWKFIEEE